MESVEHWLSALPPGVIYTVVALVVGIESLGVPLPGETALVAAALLTTSGITNVWWVAAAASLGAIVGDSIGYAIGRRGGRSLLAWLGRRFPNHLGPPHLAKAEQIFQRRGAWAIFFGRFIALLRIFAGPLAGALRVRYATFLLANASGGILWASGTTFAVYAAGKAADRWLKNFSWIALAVAIVAGITTTLILRRRAKKSFDVQPDEDDQDAEASLTS